MDLPLFLEVQTPLTPIALFLIAHTRLTYYYLHQFTYLLWLLIHAFDYSYHVVLALPKSSLYLFSLIFLIC